MTLTIINTINKITSPQCVRSTIILCINSSTLQCHLSHKIEDNFVYNFISSSKIQFVTYHSKKTKPKMKFFILFSTVVLATVNTASHAIPLNGGLVNTGASAVSRQEDGLGNYAFGYNEDHATGGTFRKEEGSHGVQIGSYGLRDADGRIRTVNYVADALGFRASVATNEPGVDPKQDPAAINLNNGLHGGLVPAPLVPAAPVLAHAGPVLAIAPVATSYGWSTQHLSTDPALLGHGSSLLAAASHY